MWGLLGLEGMLGGWGVFGAMSWLGGCSRGG